jgi:mannitol-specific phosphotransferase system IIBC component
VGFDIVRLKVIDNVAVIISFISDDVEVLIEIQVLYVISVFVEPSSWI